MKSFDELSSYEKRQAADALTVWFWARRVIFVFVCVVALIAGGCPPYGVWQQGLTGRAELRRAEQNRQIRIQEAQATRESAVHLAQAEIERARGVAEANTIIAEGLGGPDGYLRYLWIQALHDSDQDVIYVPTEAQIPILEASRLVQ